MPRVYIETTIPSFYFETRRTAEAVAWRNATRLWWDAHRHHFNLCTSILTLNELAAGPPAKSRRMLELLGDTAVLDEHPQTARVIDFYVNNRLMPAGAGGDAGHLAYASLHGIDFLLTWNCRHLANANKAQHLAVLNKRLKLSVPYLTTPMTLVPEDNADD